MISSVIPERFTESRSIIGKTTFNLASERNKGARMAWPAKSFMDIVNIEARMAVGEEAYSLGLEGHATEEVVVSSTQLNDDGDVVVYWIARFLCEPTDKEK